ncbi:MAG: hypothetical protein AAGC97_15225 [Planctomycetota bacterium]
MTRKLMKLPKKAICKWDKRTLSQALPLLGQQIESAKYVCRKCGRAASEPRLLCKSERIDLLAKQSTRGQRD